MALSAVQRHPNESPKRQSFIKSAAVGAVGAYALKWAIPVMQQEKDDVFEAEATKVNRGANRAGIGEIKNIQEANIPGSEELIGIFKKGQKAYRRIYEMHAQDFEGKPKNVTELCTRVLNRVKAVQDEGLGKLNTLTKAKRQAHIFVFTGAVVGLLYALTSNIAAEIKRDKIRDLE